MEAAGLTAGGVGLAGLKPSAYKGGVDAKPAPRSCRAGSGEFAAVAACGFEEGEEVGHAQEAAEGWVCVG